MTMNDVWIINLVGEVVQPVTALTGVIEEDGVSWSSVEDLPVSL